MRVSVVHITAGVDVCGWNLIYMLVVLFIAVCQIISMLRFKACRTASSLLWNIFALLHECAMRFIFFWGRVKHGIVKIAIFFAKITFL